MPNRTAKFASAIFASLLAGAPLATDCAARRAPPTIACPHRKTDARGQPLVLSHRARHQAPLLVSAARKAKSAQAASQIRRDPATPAPPKAEPPTPQHSVANAHAELPPPDARRAGHRRHRSAHGRRRRADAAIATNSPPRIAPDAQRTAVGRRVALARLIRRRVRQQAPRCRRPEPQRAPIRHAQPAPPPRRRLAAPLAAADSRRKTVGSIADAAIAVMAGALSLAGLIASPIFRSGARARPRQRKVRARTARDLGLDRSTDRPSSSCPSRRGDAHDARRDAPRRSARAADDPDAHGSRKCWRGWREARSLIVTASAISPAGAAGRERTRSARCGVRA